LGFTIVQPKKVFAMLGCAEGTPAVNVPQPKLCYSYLGLFTKILHSFCRNAGTKAKGSLSTKNVNI